MGLESLKTFENLSSGKRDKIVRVALEEFSAHGYQNASTNTMVKRLGIAKGSIYQYFGDKKSLFLYVFNLSLEKVKDYLRGVRDETAEEEFFTRLEKTLKAAVEFINNHPLLYRLYLRVLFESQIPYRNEILFAIRKYSHNYLRSIIETAIKRGELQIDVDSNMSGFILDAVLDRFLQAQSVEHLDAGIGLYHISEKESYRWIEYIVKVIRSGIGAKIP